MLRGATAASGRSCQRAAGEGAATLARGLVAALAREGARRAALRLPGVRGGTSVVRGLFSTGAARACAATSDAARATASALKPARDTFATLVLA